MALRPVLQETRTQGPIMHVSLATPVEPPPVPQPVQAPTPRPRSPSPSPTAPVAPAPAAPTHAPSAAPVLPQAPVAPPTPAAPNSAQIESAYAAVVRQRIEQEKVYPTSREARIQHPQGTVECW